MSNERIGRKWGWKCVSSQMAFSHLLPADENATAVRDGLHFVAHGRSQNDVETFSTFDGTRLAYMSWVFRALLGHTPKITLLTMCQAISLHVHYYIFHIDWLSGVLVLGIEWKCLVHEFPDEHTIVRWLYILRRFYIWKTTYDQHRRSVRMFMCQRSNIRF